MTYAAGQALILWGMFGAMAVGAPLAAVFGSWLHRRSGDE